MGTLVRDFSLYLVEIGCLHLIAICNFQYYMCAFRGLNKQANSNNKLQKPKHKIFISSKKKEEDIKIVA